MHSMIKEYLTKGKRGIVYSALIGRRKVIVKKPRPDSEAKNVIKNEVHWLKVLNKRGIGPKIIQSGPDFITMEYVDGLPIEEWTEENSRHNVVAMLCEVLRQCYTMDKIGLTKFEMHKPYKHVLIVDSENKKKKGKNVNSGKKANSECRSGKCGADSDCNSSFYVKLIDFERCRRTRRPKNVTQFCQYIVSKRYGTLLKSKGLNINRKALLEAARNYKADYSQQHFDEINKVIRKALNNED